MQALFTKLSTKENVKDMENHDAYKKNYIRIFGCNAWELTYGDVFKFFDELYLKATNLMDFAENGLIKDQFKLCLSKALTECQKLKTHLNQPLGTQLDRRIVDFAYELADEVSQSAILRSRH